MHHLKLLAIIFTSLVFATGCEQAAAPEETAAAEAPATGDISATELQQRIAAGNAPLILDVRTPEEYAAGHLPGAINIPHTEVADRLSELQADRGTEIAVHCQSGRRAGMAEEALAAAGFTGLRHLEGDYAGWVEANLPLER